MSEERPIAVIGASKGTGLHCILARNHSENYVSPSFSASQSVIAHVFDNDVYRSLIPLSHTTSSPSLSLSLSLSLTHTHTHSISISLSLSLSLSVSLCISLSFFSAHTKHLRRILILIRIAQWHTKRSHAAQSQGTRRHASLQSMPAFRDISGIKQEKVS